MAQSHTSRFGTIIWSIDGLSPIEATDRDAGVEIHQTSGSYQVYDVWWVEAAWCNMLPVRSSIRLKNCSYSPFKFIEDMRHSYFEIFDFTDVDFTVRVEFLDEGRLTGKRKHILKHVVNGPDSECFRWNSFSV